MITTHAQFWFFRKLSGNSFSTSFYVWFFKNPVDTGRKLNAHKTFRRHPERLLNVLCTFNLRPVSTGKDASHIYFIKWLNIIWLILLSDCLYFLRWISVVCFPGGDVVSFEINLIFLIKRFFYMTKKSREKFKYLENGNSF